MRVTKPYSLPEEVAKVVSIVDDIMRFPSVRSPLRSFGGLRFVTNITTIIVVIVIIISRSIT